MPNYFIDTSALAKRYHKEHGSVALPVYESHFQRARHLLLQYGVSEGLRTLDSLQLAIALDLQQSGHIGVLVSADQRLCRVASLAGCPARNPDKPGPVLV